MDEKNNSLDTFYNSEPTDNQEEKADSVSSETEFVQNNEIEAVSEEENLPKEESQENNNSDQNISEEYFLEEEIPTIETETEKPAIPPIPRPLSIPEDKPQKAAKQPSNVYHWDYVSQCEHDKAAGAKKARRGVFRYIAVLGSAFVVAIALLVGVLLLGDNNANGYASDAGISDLYEECVTSYVAINTTTAAGTGTGSGIIYTSDGYIITNYHVVGDAETIQVILYNDKTYDAVYVAGDELNDVAVLKVDAKGLTAAKIGSSTNSRVGDRVMAIGTPYSINYRGTMTSGYISYLNRKYIEQDDNGLTKRVIYLIQTDTSISPGNSGGPLFNMKGEVIGIVSLKMVNTGYEGIGFAIPIESVIDMVREAVSTGSISSNGGAVEGAAIGISGFDCVKDTKYLINGNYHYPIGVDEDGREYISSYPPIKIYLDDEEALAEMDIGEDRTFVITAASGVYVQKTTQGFDAASKLQQGDIIVKVNGSTCTGIDQIREYVAAHKVGDSIDLTVLRNGEEINVQVKLGKSALMN